MKDFLRFGKNFLIVLAIVAVVNVVLGLLFDKTAVFIDTVKYKRIVHGTEEVVVLGASRAENQYVSNLIADSLGTSVFNYGVGAQNIYTNYCVLKLLCEKSKTTPKIVIWDFYYTDIVDAPKYNTEKLQRLYSAINYDESVHNVLRLLDKKEYLLLKYLPLYKFNSKLVYCLSDYIVPSKEPLKGYSPLFVKYDKPLSDNCDDRGKISDSKLDYINKFIALCKDNNIKLFIFISPGFYNINNPNSTGEDWAQVIKSIADENSVKLFNYEQDGFFLEHPELFYNTTHLNSDGAIVYTNMIIRDIKEALYERKH